MFENLTAAERDKLDAKLASAERQFLTEYDLLRDAPPAVLASYQAISTDWLMAGVEMARMLREFRAQRQPTGTGWPA